MTCFADQPVKLETIPVTVPRLRGGGAVDTRYQSRATCGWTSKSVGTEEQALSWGRRHAQTAHEDAALLPCDGDRHPINRRNGFCRACEYDSWPKDRRDEWTAKQW